MDAAATCYLLLVRCQLVRVESTMKFDDIPSKLWFILYFGFGVATNFTVNPSSRFMTSRNESLTPYLK